VVPIKESVTIDEVIAILNRALEEDRGAISELMLDHKVVCNKGLAEDETIQVGRRTKSGNSENIVGVLGLLNGLFGVNDGEHGTHYGAIAARVDGKEGIIKSFTRLDHEKFVIKPIACKGK
jgi:hypothetical protein